MLQNAALRFRRKIRRMRRVWVPWLIFVWTFAISVARAIRLPNDFSEAHWLLDYRFGFMKRGLIGSICSATASLFGFSMTPGIIVWLAAITTGCLYAAFLVIAFRTLKEHSANSGPPLVVLVFASSPFLVVNAHLFGYFDALLYGLAIASIALVLANRAVLASFVSVIALLTHESYLVIGFPLVCLASFLYCTSEDHRSQWPRHATALSIPLFVFLGIVVAQSVFIDMLVLRQQLIDYLRTFDFIPTRITGVAIWQTTGFFEFLQEQGGYLIRRLLHPGILTALGPTLLALLYFIHSSFRLRPFGWLSLILLGVVGSPLVMHAIAWDTARISSYVVGGAFISAWIFLETRRPRPTEDLFMLIAVPVLVLNVFARIPLMDNELDGFSNLERALFYSPALGLALFWVVMRKPSRPRAAGTET